MRVFAILHEPAQYTTDRNHAVYDKLGIHYAYIHGQSEAKSDTEVTGRPLSDLSLIQLWTWLRKLLCNNDIIIMNGYNNRVFMLLFLQNIVYRRAIGLDSDTPLSVPRSPLKRLVKAMYLNTIFSNHHVYGLAGGTGSHKELFRYYGMKEVRIFLMPMMVDNSKFYANTEKKEKPFVFLYVGRIVECKNLDVMLKAFVRAFGGNEEAELHIIGGGDMSDNFEKKYTQHKNILFLGKRFGKDLISSYQSAHAFVLPSMFEPWGLVVNEAMSAGLPVVVSDQVGASHDLVEGHETGFIFHYNDVRELAECMKTIYDDKNLYRTFANNAYHRMHDEWNYVFYEECLKRFIDYVAKK